MSVKSASVNVLLVVVALAVSLALAEAGVRIFFPVYDPSGQLEFQSGKNGRPVLGTPNAQYRQWKNTGDYEVSVRFNRYGLRDDKDLATARPGDIFVVGDSFSFGWGVEARQRYSDRLAEYLGTRVFNISTPGNFDNYANLVRYAERNDAHIGRLVIGVCMENDLLDYDDPNRKDRGDRPVRLIGIKARLTKYSALYAMATTAVHGNPTLKALAVKFGLITPNLDGVPKGAYSERVIRSSVNRLKALASGHAAIAVIIPSRALWIGRERETADLIHREFVAAVRRAGIDVVDLRATFEATGDPLALHFKNDGHWNARGHDLAAKALAATLLGQSRMSKRQTGKGQP